VPEIVAALVMLSRGYKDELEQEGKVMPRRMMKITLPVQGSMKTSSG